MANFFANMKISRKLVAVFLATSVIAMGVNIFIYVNLNQALDKINQVFSSNISLNELSDNLNQIHTGLTGYLETKGTDDLELYYSSTQSMNFLMSNLNSDVTDNSVKLSERDIRKMLETYLKTADDEVYCLGKNTVIYDPQAQNMTIYGSSYRINDDGTVETLDEVNVIEDTNTPKLYKLRDRMYVMTGRDMPQSVQSLCDYITEMKKIKHPFDEGITAREGIEY